MKEPPSAHPDLELGAQSQRVTELTEKNFPLLMVPLPPLADHGAEAKQLESSKSHRCVLKFEGIQGHPKEKA